MAVAAFWQAGTHSPAPSAKEKAISISINWILVAALAIGQYGLGALWYSTAMFGKPWMRMLGITRGDIRDIGFPIALAYAVTLLLSFVTTIGVAALVSALSLTGPVAGGLCGAAVFATVELPLAVKRVFWETLPVKLAFIDYGYDAVSFVTVGALLATFG